jgi:hypothetical protein
VCGKGAIFAEATTQPRLPHLDPTQIRRLEAAPARPVTLLSSFEQYAGFPKSPAQDDLRRLALLHVGLGVRETGGRGTSEIVRPDRVQFVGDLVRQGTTFKGRKDSTGVSELLNFSGTTLTSGTYSVGGTLQFGASGTSIVTVSDHLKT